MTAVADTWVQISRPSLQRSTFLLDGQKHFCRVQVDKPDISAYRALLSREASHGQQE